MGQTTPATQFEEAKSIARAHNMFAVDKGDRYILFRRAAPRPIYLGARTDPAEFRRFVARCATTS